MRIVERVREVLPPRYREMAKFLVVGGTAWIVDTGLFTLLSHTILDDKVIVAKAISILVSTVLSYILNREWSFRTRGGRERPHEALLFFGVNGLALLLNLIPLAMSRYVFGFTTPEYSQGIESFADFVSANVIGTLVGMIFRYWAYRRFVFPDELEPAQHRHSPATSSAAESDRGDAVPAPGEAPVLGPRGGDPRDHLTP